MTTVVYRFLVGVALLLFFVSLQAATPLVSDSWLTDNLNRTDLVVLDLQPNGTYQRYHIPGAVHSDYSDWRRPDARQIPKMLPTVKQLEKLIGGLGIDNQTQVVLVITGRSASEMASATRVYWTFKAMGHDLVSILDGGLLTYANRRGNRLESGINRPKRKTFTANLRTDYLVSADRIKALLGGDATLVDNRSGAEHVGLLSGNPEERPGTIPGAVNLPFSWLTINGGAQFHTVENLQRIYTAVGVPTSGRQISFCHTGHRTSLAWFVSHELLGNSEAQLYDGSTTEWAADPSLPLKRIIALD